jgi:methionine-S-sulfoxide reductase
MLVRHFFRLHDPTQLNRQGPDVGDQYRSAIFYADDEQKAIAEQIRDELQTKTNDPIVTQIVPATTFYVAEDYHQKFTERTGRGMCHVPYAAI